MSMRRRLERWRTLDWRQRRILIGCSLGATAMHAGLALLGYARVRRIVEACSRHRAPGPATPSDVASAKELAWLAALAARQAVGEAACLRRSLLVYGLLRRRGLLPVLQLGIGPHVATFRAHAWIELEGTPLLDSDAMFRPFVRQATPSRMR